MPLFASDLEATWAFRTDPGEEDPEPGPSWEILRGHLRAEWPALAAALEPGDTARVADLEVVSRAVKRARSGAAGRETSDLALFAANLWCEALERTIDGDNNTKDAFNRLMRPHGGEIVETHYGLCYNDGLLRSLPPWAGGSNRWADYAFLTI